MKIREHFSIEQKLQIIEWLYDHPNESYNTASRFFGVHKKTIYNWLIRSPELGDIVRARRESENREFIERIVALVQRMAAN